MLDLPEFTKTEAALIDATARSLGADPYKVAAIVYTGICLGSIDGILSSWKIADAYRSATRDYVGG